MTTTAEVGSRGKFQFKLDQQVIEKSLIDILWVLLSAGLVLLMQAGFLCLEAGMTRSKNSINVAIKNLADFGIAVVLFWAFGFAALKKPPPKGGLFI